jgi:hypothetical protein
MSTPVTPTEAHYDLANVLSLSDDYHKDARLIAESEARAVEAYAVKTRELLQSYMTERDQLRIKCRHLSEGYDQLRAEMEQKSKLLTLAVKSAGDQAARAERAEAELVVLRRLLIDSEEAGTIAKGLRAELATERARLDYIINSFSTEHPFRVSRAAIDAAMEDGK